MLIHPDEVEKLVMGGQPIFALTKGKGKGGGGLRGGGGIEGWGGIGGWGGRCRLGGYACSPSQPML